MKLLLVAACALVDSQARMLIAERPAGKSMAGLWEFPGGKVEAGERPEQALVREMREELGIAIDEGALEPLAFASHAYADFHLLMPVFICRRWEGELQPAEEQRIAWVRVEDLPNYPMPPADLPLIPKLKSLLIANAPSAPE